MRKEVPDAPKTPLYICYREVVPKQGDEWSMMNAGVHAILPYVDLPRSDKNREGFAYIRADGERGIITKDTVEQFTIPRSPESKKRDIREFDHLIRSKHWEPIYLSWKHVDFKKQFHFRGDDGDFDVVALSIFKGLGDIVCCPYCAHPMHTKEVEMKLISDSINSVDEAKCEECEYEISTEDYAWKTALKNATGTVMPAGSTGEHDNAFRDEWR